MVHTMRCSVWVICLCLALVGRSSAQAPADGVVLGGRVSDELGGVLVGAEIQVSSPAGDRVAVAVTDRDGLPDEGAGCPDVSRSRPSRRIRRCGARSRRRAARPRRSARRGSRRGTIRRACVGGRGASRTGPRAPEPTESLQGSAQRRHHFAGPDSLADSGAQTGVRLRPVEQHDRRVLHQFREEGVQWGAHPWRQQPRLDCRRRVPAVAGGRPHSAGIARQRDRADGGDSRFELPDAGANGRLLQSLGFANRRVHRHPDAPRAT